MIMRKPTVLLLSLLFIAVPLFAQVDQTSARALGMGGAYSAASLDGNAPIWNPGAMDAFKQMALSLNYSTFHVGITDDFLQEGAISYVLHLDRRFKYGSLGIAYTQWLSDVYSQGVLKVGYSKRIFGDPEGTCLSVGANFSLYRSGFNDANYSETFDPADPLFADGTSSLVYTADAGIFYRATQWLSLGASVQNLTTPDISISGTADDKLPMKVRTGLAFDFDFIQPVVEVEYATEAASDKNLDVHIGAEKKLGENFALRAGWNRYEAGLGLGYFNRGEKYHWGIDYAALYPVATQMAKDFLTTHRISFNLFIDPPPVPIQDLAIVDNSVSIVPARLVLGQEVTISAKIENRGEVREKNVPVCIYYQDANQNWVKALPIDNINIQPGEIINLSKKWTPPTKGEYTIYIAVDDAGIKLPAIAGKIDEVDEDNNSGFSDCIVFRKPEGMIEPEKNRLNVSKLLLYQEEEPIVPVVFFAPNDKSIDARFNRMLSIVANRLKANADSRIEVEGYFDPQTDNIDKRDELALSRAEEVKAKLVSLGAPSERVVVKRSGYEFNRSRAGIPDEQMVPKDKTRMHDENRRAELHAWFVEGKDFLVKALFPQNGTNLSNSEEIARVFPNIRQLLRENEEVILLVEGFSQQRDENLATKSFAQASTVADYIKTQLPEYADRIYINQTVEKTVPEGEVWIYPNSEGVVYRPREADRVLEDYTVEGSEDNTIKIDAEIDAGVDSFAVSIIDEKNATIRLLVAGKGQMPKGIGWDWRDEAGMLLDFDEKYFAKMQVWDKMGEQLVTKSDTMAIQVSKQGKRVESLVIVVFTFNEDNPQSKFLESRVEYVAKRLIYRAEKGQFDVFATVTGHSDSIGPEYANLSISKDRASRELTKIRKFMKYHLKLASDTELDKWLREHKVTLQSKGMGESTPYDIRRWDVAAKKAEMVRIGENKLPEGRTLNRRVVLDMTSQKLPE